MKYINHIFALILVVLPACIFGQEKNNIKKLSIELGYRILSENSKGDYQGGNYYENDLSGPVTFENVNFKTFGQQIYAQVNLESGRWIVPLQLGFLQWKDKIRGNIIYSETDYDYFPSAPFNQTITTHDLDVNYAETSSYLTFSAGVGFNLLNPGSKFYVGPLVRINPQIRVSRKILSSEVQEDYYIQSSLYADQSESRESTYKDLSRYVKNDQPVSTDFMHGVLGIRPSAGILLGGTFIGNFGVHLEAGFKFQHLTRIEFGNTRFVNGAYCQLGLTYELNN